MYPYLSGAKSLLTSYIISSFFSILILSFWTIYPRNSQTTAGIQRKLVPFLLSTHAVDVCAWSAYAHIRTCARRVLFPNICAWVKCVSHRRFMHRCGIIFSSLEQFDGMHSTRSMYKPAATQVRSAYSHPRLSASVSRTWWQVVTTIMVMNCIIVYPDLPSSNTKIKIKDSILTFTLLHLILSARVTFRCIRFVLAVCTEVRQERDGWIN